MCIILVCRFLIDVYMPMCICKYVYANMYMQICICKYVYANMYMRICICKCQCCIVGHSSSIVGSPNSRLRYCWLFNLFPLIPACTARPGLPLLPDSSARPGLPLSAPANGFDDDRHRQSPSHHSFESVTYT